MARKEDLTSLDLEEINRFIFQDQDEPNYEGSDLEDAPTEVETSSDESDESFSVQDSPDKHPSSPVELLPRSYQCLEAVPEPDSSRGGPVVLLSRCPEQVISPFQGQRHLEAIPEPGPSHGGPVGLISRRPAQVISPSSDPSSLEGILIPVQSLGGPVGLISQ